MCCLLCANTCIIIKYEDWYKSDKHFQLQQGSISRACDT